MHWTDLPIKITGNPTTHEPALEYSRVQNRVESSGRVTRGRNMKAARRSLDDDYFGDMYIQPRKPKVLCVVGTVFWRLCGLLQSKP